jgi:hypothetical protein
MCEDGLSIQDSNTEKSLQVLARSKKEKAGRWSGKGAVVVQRNSRIVDVIICT